ncbi:hypothetical protein [Stenomitos frigidus]|uniref:Uncharacterized protein n=1 Tax=Stenomitos frigidus ULC18 TaxID=2107698 RepID=A0A2T1E8Y9_9CYAN|nr:hypothetical protein [Stenomitos frigidus]PSB29188.1 hypothetical protein C7B82_12195 [Stenomitos frigidus ULC18]
MAPKALTVIVRIKSGEAVALHSLLAEIGSHIRTNSYVRWTESRLVHFARWAILPDTDRGGSRLLFACNYDGELEAFLEELVAIAPGLDQIWGRCEGYTGQTNLLAFIQEHTYKPQAFFIAFQTATVQTIRNAIALREQMQNVLDLPCVAQWLVDPSITSFLDQLAQVPKVMPWWKSIGHWGMQVMMAVGTGVEAIADAIRRALIAIAKLLVKRLGQPTKPQTLGSYSGLDTDKTQALEAVEDRIVQNQMNIITDIQPVRLLRLRLILLMIDVAAKYLFPPGELLDIRTIHFARWVIIDGGKRLLFISNYDGSWENYIGDFVDKGNFGLNAIWNNSVNYPPGGAQDIVSFRKYVRDHQLPSQVFYCAYPQATVKNILRDRHISQTLAADFSRETVEHWLELL